MTSILQKWCYLLSMKKIYFNIHRMLLGDCLLINFQHKNHIYLIVQGSVKVNQVFTNTNKLTIGILMEDDLINIISLPRTKKSYYYSAEALSSALIISYNHKMVLQRPHEYISLYHELLSAQERLIIRSNDIIQVLSHRDKKCRLINLLLILCKQFGIITRFGIMINLIITHNTLGGIIGSSRTTITKILNSLQGYRLLSVYHNKLLIHDPISLCLYHKTWLYIINL